MKKILTLALVCAAFTLSAQKAISYDTKATYQDGKWSLDYIYKIDAVFVGNAIIIDDLKIIIVEPFDDKNPVTVNSWVGIVNGSKCDVYLTVDFLLISCKGKSIKYSK